MDMILRGGPRFAPQRPRYAPKDYPVPIPKPRLSPNTWSSGSSSTTESTK